MPQNGAKSPTLHQTLPLCTTWDHFAPLCSTWDQFHNPKFEYLYKVATWWEFAPRCPKMYQGAPSSSTLPQFVPHSTIWHHFAPHKVVEPCPTLHHFCPSSTTCPSLHHFVTKCTTTLHFAPPWFSMVGPISLLMMSKDERSMALYSACAPTLVLWWEKLRKGIK